MKKVFIMFACCCFAAPSSIFAQNLQLHYDFGKNRHYFTATWEMFKPDEYGSTYTFVDFDFNNSGNKSISTAYWEIARYVSVYHGLSVTLQYNDGTLRVPSTGMNIALGSIWLAGVSYPVNLGFVTLNTDLLYRKDYQSQGSDMQVTTVWYVPLWEGRIAFDGFMDIWSQKYFFNDKRVVVLLTEPQVWLNLTKHVSVGSEVEISNNFIPGESKVQVNPTIAVKWNF